jgi:hypothetical protein
VHRKELTLFRSLLAVPLLVLACAGAPEPPAPGRSSIEGTFRLVPREGVTPGGSGSSPYASRALRDVAFVDYAHPGFAVVYLEGRASPAGAGELTIRSTRLQTRLEPSTLALGAGGTVRVHNGSAEPHVVSIPGAARIQRLAPGESVEAPLAAGRHSVFLLDVPESEAAVFAAPGPFALVAEDGRWAIRDVEPGRVHVVGWHARFPAASHWLELAPGGVARLELAVGVGREGADETR